MALLGPDGLPLTLDPPPATDGGVMIVNETDLPDNAVREAVATSWVEHSSLNFGQDFNQFQTYANSGGSMLARAKWTAPTNVFDEIKLARDLAEKDDDVGATIGAMIALAYGEGMQNTHADEVTVSLYNEIAKNANLDSMTKEMYREWLIAAGLTTVSLFTRETFSFIPEGTERYRTRRIVAPLVGILPAEQIRVLDNDIFGTGTLAYKPDDSGIWKWLEEWFSPRTDAARKNQMRQEDPVMAALFVARIQMPMDESDIFNAGQVVYKLNPRMAHRSTMPKGAWKYPRPPLTRDFALLEAKRLLNIMDYALLQGGANFIVLAKKGSDQRPGTAEEVANLREVVRHAGRSGVIVGDHRLDLQVITPDLNELLNPEKRRLLGRKIAMALLRVPEHMTDAAGSEGMKAEVEVLTRVVTSDRRDLKRHQERYVYEETAKRNARDFPQGPAKLWYPKIILQGTQYFTDYILKMRDRGDIPRRYAVEAGGFDYAAAVQQRQREKDAGHDEIMTPGEVPFSSPEAGPQDNNTGRPSGSSPNNGAPGAAKSKPASARPQKVIKRTAGETVKAVYDDDEGRVIRVGDLTEGILEEYGATLHKGRLSKLERDALESGETMSHGGVAVVPVNPEFDCDEYVAVRLYEGVSIICGKRKTDGAAVTKAVVVKEPTYRVTDAEDLAVRWGFDVTLADVPALPGSET